jgi:hypothetical protein
MVSSLSISKQSRITQAIADQFSGSADFLQSFMKHTGLAKTSKQALNTDTGDAREPSKRRLSAKLSTLLVGEEGADALSKMSTHNSSANESSTYGDEWNLDDLYVGACVTVSGVISFNDAALGDDNCISEPITSNIPTEHSSSSSVEEQGNTISEMHSAI